MGVVPQRGRLRHRSSAGLKRGEKALKTTVTKRPNLTLHRWLNRERQDYFVWESIDSPPFYLMGRDVIWIVRSLCEPLLASFRCFLTRCGKFNKTWGTSTVWTPIRYSATCRTFTMYVFCRLSPQLQKGFFLKVLLLLSLVVRPLLLLFAVVIVHTE